MLGSILFAALSVLQIAAVAKTAPQNRCGATVTTSLQALGRGQMVEAGKDFDAKLSKSHDSAALTSVWNSLLHEAGEFQRVGTSRGIRVGGRSYVLTNMVFSKGTMESISACDAAGKISFFEWSRASDAEEKISGAKPQIGPGGIRILPTTVSSQWGPLPAILTLPMGKAPFPAVVLVAGAGPQDENATIGPNKPLEDLANGLATNGIASLRYEKSIRAYPAEAGLDKTVTVDDTETNDAVTALNVLRSTKQVNPREIFLIGHSLGAMMVPRIVERGPQIAGAIMMASPSESILVNGVAQTRYIAHLQHTPAAKLQKQLDSLDQEEMLLGKTPHGQIPPGQYLGMPQSWWMSLHEYDQIKEAESLKIPLLILQGSADFQVSPQENFPRWQRLFLGNPRVTLIEYPGLSHIFMPAGNPPSPADYDKPLKMDNKVIADISAWIHKQAVRR